VLISFITKETIIVNDNQQLLEKHDEKADPISAQANAQPANAGRQDGLAKVAIGTVVGALLGAVVGALANKKTAQGINNAVKNVGDSVKSVAEGVNQTVKDVGEAVKNVAENVNYTAKDVGDAVKGAAEGVTKTVTVTVDAVSGTAEDVSHTVEGTVDALKGAAEGVTQTVKGNPIEAPTDADKQQVKTASVGKGAQAETQKTYILVPVENE